ncbi:MAG: response regulator transcription factor [Daejeonella sp.]
MIADDDPGILDAVGMMLEFEGYAVTSTLKGANVLLLENDFPDLFLLDIWMPGQDGRDICRELKKKAGTRNIPVIMISASTELAKSARDAGADDFLEKPFNMTELLEKIASHLA